MSHRGVGTPEHPVRMGRKLVGKTPRVSFQAQRRAETGAWEGDGGGGERERETPVYRAAALCRQTFRCMAWGGVLRSDKLFAGIAGSCFPKPDVSEF